MSNHQLLVAIIVPIVLNTAMLAAVWLDLSGVINTSFDGTEKRFDQLFEVWDSELTPLKHLGGS